KLTFSASAAVGAPSAGLAPRASPHRPGHPKVALATIGFLCSRLRETDLRLEAIALYRIEVRLARLLLSALRLELPAAKGFAIPLDLGISQSELALLIGASRSKVNSALTLLQGMGAIARNGTKLTCNT